MRSTDECGGQPDCSLFRSERPLIPTQGETRMPEQLEAIPELKVDRRSKSRRNSQDRRTVDPENFDGDDRRESGRRQIERRRQIDPTTCERDYQPEEIEFMRAMDDYKRRSGRQFPTWSEVLEVLRDLGYRKVASPTTTYEG